MPGYRLLRQMPAITSLDLSGSQRTDSGLWSVSLTESGVETIATLRELQHLRLNGLGISPRGLEKLSRLDQAEPIGLTIVCPNKRRCCEHSEVFPGAPHRGFVGGVGNRRGYRRTCTKLVPICESFTVSSTRPSPRCRTGRRIRLSGRQKQPFERIGLSFIDDLANTKYNGPVRSNARETFSRIA